MDSFSFLHLFLVTSHHHDHLFTISLQIESYSSWCDPRKENSQGVEPYRVIRTRTHKLILWQSGTVELYDWPADPEEKRNLAGDPSSQKVLGLLKRKLEAQMSDRKDPMLAKPVVRVE